MAMKSVMICSLCMAAIAATVPACTQSTPYATSISSPESAGLAIQQVRRDFEILPRPLISDYTRTDKNRIEDQGVIRTENAPGIHEMDLQRKSDLVLTTTTRNFIAQHSKTELITALSPLLDDPMASADAYTVLGSITGDLSAPQVLRESGYHNSAAPGQWSHFRPHAVLELKQHFDAILFAPESDSEMSGSTLGHTIHRIQHDVAALPSPVVRDWIRHRPGPDSSATSTYAEAVLTPSAAELLQKYPKNVLVSSLYPLIYSPLASDRAVIILTKALDADAQLGASLPSYHQRDLESEPVRQRLDALARDYLLHGAD